MTKFIVSPADHILVISERTGEFDRCKDEDSILPWNKVVNRIHVQEGDELKGEGRPAPRFTACRLLPMSEEDFPIDSVDSGMPSSPLPF